MLSPERRMSGVEWVSAPEVGIWLSMLRWAEGMDPRVGLEIAKEKAIRRMTELGLRPNKKVRFAEGGKGGWMSDHGRLDKALDEIIRWRF